MKLYLNSKKKGKKDYLDIKFSGFIGLVFLAQLAMAGIYILLLLTWGIISSVLYGNI